MPDILGAANPVPGYDKSNINRSTPVSPEKVQIQNSPDLTKINRADGKTEWQDSNQQGDGRIRYDSNFQTFLQRLQNTPSLVESLTKILSMKDGILVTSGLNAGTAEEMGQILSMLQMDQQELMRFLAGQMKSGSRLNGPLFALLRNAYANAASNGVRSDILQFVKNYLDYSATSHVEGNLLRNLQMMTDALPASWAERLREMMAQLNNGIAAGDRQGNLQLLQRGILPYISRYIEQTHDMGLPRELSTLLALNVARYENGSLDNLFSSFHQLAGYGTLKGVLSGIDDQGLLEILSRNQLEAGDRAIQFADQLANLAAKGLRGSSGAEAQQAFQNLVNAMLLNESVYMPLNHYLLPLKWEDRMLFSELWVDPNAEDGQERSGEKRGRSIRVLMKLDVQDMGLFDVVLRSKEDTVDIQVSYPPAATAFTKLMEQGIVEILTRNELRPGMVTIRRMERPVTLTEVFPRIFEGMNSINVKV